MAARSSQLIVEVAKEASPSPARVSQLIVEVAKTAGASPARVSQLIVEVAILEGGGGGGGGVAVRVNQFIGSGVYVS